MGKRNVDRTEIQVLQIMIILIEKEYFYSSCTNTQFVQLLLPCGAFSITVQSNSIIDNISI